MLSFVVHVDLAGGEPDRRLAERALAALPTMPGAAPGDDGAALGSRTLGAAIVGWRGRTAVAGSDAALRPPAGRLVVSSRATGSEARVSASRPVLLLLDGRIDDRQALLLDRPPDTPPHTSTATEGDDAALLLAAWLQLGDAVFAHLHGPFAVVVWDSAARRLVAARDGLGDRTLSYAVRNGVLRLSTHERVLLADPEVPAQADEVSAARYFAYRAPLAGSTWYSALRSLPPGCLLVAEDGRVRIERFARVAAVPWQDGREDEAVERFADVFAAAVHCRLRGAGRRPGVLMSGGLDSTSLAAVVASGDRLDPGAPPALAVTWGFDGLPDCDERGPATEVAERLGLDLLTVSGDALVPLAPSRPLPEVAERPGSDLYHPLLSAAFTAAADAGIAVLLGGHHANQLWQGEDGWLRDLLARGRFATGLRLAASLLRPPGSPAERRRRLRRAVGSLVARPRTPALAPSWMTPGAAEHLAVGEAGEERGPEPPDPRGAWGPLRPYWTEEAVRLRRHAAGTACSCASPIGTAAWWS